MQEKRQNPTHGTVNVRSDSSTKERAESTASTEEKASSGQRQVKTDGELKKKRKLTVDSDDEQPERERAKATGSKSLPEQTSSSTGGEQIKSNPIAMQDQPVDPEELAQVLEWKRLVEEALAREDGVDDDAIGRALDGLEGVIMTLPLLAQSGVGKAITKLRKSSSKFAGRAKSLYEEWKTLAI